MGARSIQISIDENLLEEIDNLSESRGRGRSLLIRRALRMYLDRKRQMEIDAAYEAAYSGAGEEKDSELDALLDSQEWPKTE